MPKDRRAGHLVMFAVTLIFGINIPLSKSLLPTWISPEGLTLSRILFGTSIFWIASLFTTYEKVPWKEHRLLFVGALCGVVFNQGLFITGLNMTSAIDASIIITSGPLFAMIFAAILLKEPISFLKISGIIVGASGAILLVYNGHHVSNSNTSSLAGNLMVFGSSFIYAFYLVFSKPLTLRYSPVTMMKWMFLYATILLTPFYYKQILSAPVYLHPEKIAVIQMFYTLVFATFLTYLLIPMAQQRIRPTTISMYNNFQPLIASFVAISVGMDHFSAIKLFSAVLIFSGVYLVTRSKAKPEVAEMPQESAAGKAILLPDDPAKKTEETRIITVSAKAEKRDEGKKCGKIDGF